MALMLFPDQPGAVRGMALVAAPGRWPATCSAATSPAVNPTTYENSSRPSAWTSPSPAPTTAPHASAPSTPGRDRSPQHPLGERITDQAYQQIRDGDRRYWHHSPTP